MSEFRIGCHLSSSGGFLAMGQTAESIGANVFQFFTRNPRGGAAKNLDKTDVGNFIEFAAANGIGPILAHAPYTLNAASADKGTREFAERIMADDLRRMSFVPGSLYNFHPGSHVSQGVDVGIELISGMLSRLYEKDSSVFSVTTVLLETMAGKGSEVGGRFEELRSIIDKVPFEMGVCLDTCHVWDAGYDIVDDLDGVLSEFDRVIGLERLKAIHLNDSMNAAKSRKDRHEKIGRGKIGLEAMKRIINHPRLASLPFFLETPCDLQGYKEEIDLLKSMRT